MKKAIETPAGSGDVVVGAASSAESDPAESSARATESPGAEEETEGGRAKGASRRPRRRPRRTRAKEETAGENGAGSVATESAGDPDPAPTHEAYSAAKATPPVDAVASAVIPTSDTWAADTTFDTSLAAQALRAELALAEVEAVTEERPGATGESTGPRATEGRTRRRRSGGGRKKAAAAEPAAEAVASEAVAGELAAGETAITAEVVEAIATGEAVIVTPDREAAEPISAGRPEIELEPPTLPEPPEPEMALAGEPIALHELPDPEPNALEEAPPDLPEPPARERGRRRRGRGDRARARAQAATAPAAEPAEVEEEAPQPEPAPERLRATTPAREKPASRARGEKAKRPEEPEKAERVDRVDRADRAEPIEKGERAEKAERLAKEIIVNVDARETRIAVIENNRLVELHVEREERVVGSIYKGRVANVLPGMDAAFVDIGLERNAFLYVGDILYESGDENGHTHRRAGREVKIRDVAKTGQEILVQVVKGPRGTKGARVSTRMSLPGRFIVLMPDAENLGVSRKIEDAGERERLKKIGEVVRPQGFGMIIRTEAEGKTERDLRQDMELLVRLWKQIQEKARRTPPPGLVHQDLSLLLKTIRDVFGSDVDRLLLDSPSDYAKVLELLEMLSPNLKSRVELYSGAEPIFHHFALDDEIERLLRRKVWLKSGGYITVDSTEALTAIDVNTGKFIGSTSLSDTILKTNLDAVAEITRQFRLRDLGGMIIIDFIDMNSARDRAQVMAALERALKKDRTRTKVAHISPLGLVEMTRKRTGETVTELLTQSCPYCQGRGRVSSPESVSIQIERLIKRRCAETDVDAILVLANPEVAAHLIGPEGDNIEVLEKEVRRPVYVRARHDFHMEKFEILPGDMMELEQQILPYRGGQVVECMVQKMELITAPRSAAWVDGYFVDLANGTRFQGQKARVRLTDVRRSFALGEPVTPAHALDKSEPI